MHVSDPLRISTVVNITILGYTLQSQKTFKYNIINNRIRPSHTAAFPTFAANRKEVLNLSSQEDLGPN